MAPEDKILVEAILNYIQTLNGAVEEYSLSEQILQVNLAFRGMAAFFVQQIGECAKKLSSDFKSRHKELNWRAMSGLRNRIAHAYGEIDVEILWNVIESDLPELETFCRNILSTAKAGN